MTSLPFAPRGVAIRLFLTCWLVFVLHFATNTVREIYLGLALGDHFSFRVDEYAGLHPDLFEKPGYGWHIGSNPGASMLGAIPYALARPVIDAVVRHVNRSRAEQGLTEPPAYNSVWPMSREFYRQAWQRGLDVKFGLGAFAMQAGCMAPLSALGVVVMFYFLREICPSDRAALWLALLYAFGTPVFFRAGYLNHNMLVGHFGFLGFLLVWRARDAGPALAVGLAAGMALLLDYSGALLVAGLLGYALWKMPASKVTILIRYAMGAAGPILLLWFYQWRSFGNPFLPGQNWMPPVEWIDLGYQGVGFPQPELAGLLLADYRFGLFVTCPLLLLALPGLIWRDPGKRLQWFDLSFLFGVFLVLWIFFSGVNYTRLQFNTGLRYLTPAIPFLFVLVATTLLRLPRWAACMIGIAAVAQAWSMAMYRDVERGYGVLEPILHVFLGGFQLPAMGTLSRIGNLFAEYMPNGPSPLPVLAVAGALLAVLWNPKFWPAAKVEMKGQ